MKKNPLDVTNQKLGDTISYYIYSAIIGVKTNDSRRERERRLHGVFEKRAYVQVDFLFFLSFFKYVHIDREDGTREIRRR